jgi:hypothetical protein
MYNKVTYLKGVIFMEKNTCVQCKGFDETKDSFGNYWICDDCKLKQQTKENSKQ